MLSFGTKRMVKFWGLHKAILKQDQARGRAWAVPGQSLGSAWAEPGQSLARAVSG